MKIYFAGSIRGGRSDAHIYSEVIKLLQSYGTVLTEHVGSDKFLSNEKSMTDEEIFLRDMDWLKESDIICAEVTQPSLGVGYELAMAQNYGKKVICLFNDSKGGKLSAMITGDAYYTIHRYTSWSDIVDFLVKYFNNINT